MHTAAEDGLCGRRSESNDSDHRTKQANSGFRIDGTIPKLGGLYGPSSKRYLQVCAIYSKTTVTIEKRLIFFLHGLLPGLSSSTQRSKRTWARSAADFGASKSMKPDLPPLGNSKEF